jgi:hypothetical protein
MRIVPNQHLQNICRIDLIWHLEGPEYSETLLPTLPTSGVRSNEERTPNMVQPQADPVAKSEYSIVWDMLSSLTSLTTLRVCAVVPRQEEVQAYTGIIWLLPMLKLADSTPDFVFAIPPPFTELLKIERDKLGYSFEVEDPTSFQYSELRNAWL